MEGHLRYHFVAYWVPISVSSVASSIRMTDSTPNRPATQFGVRHFWPVVSLSVWRYPFERVEGWPLA